MSDKIVRQERLRLNEEKWKQLRKRGITPPRNEAERQQRLKDAHASE